MRKKKTGRGLPVFCRIDLAFKNLEGLNWNNEVIKVIESHEVANILEHTEMQGGEKRQICLVVKSTRGGRPKSFFFGDRSFEVPKVLRYAL